jgi:adenylate kinase family enzyme
LQEDPRHRLRGRRQVDEFDAALEELLAGPEWVMDGNYSRTMRRRLELADGVVLIDLPRWRACSGSCAARCATWAGRELPEGCRERLSLEFVRWVWDYPRRSLPKVQRLLGEAAREKVVVVARSRAELQRLLSAW